MPIEIIFWIFLAVVVFTDVKYGKIYNLATFPAAAFGLIYAFVAAGPAGFFSSALGFLAGLALLGWVYYLGGCGGGDVKFLAAVGALTGYEFVVVGALWGFIIAGASACVFLLIKGQFRKTWGNTFDFLKSFFFFGGQKMRKNSEMPDMPYGVYLSLGFAAYRIWRYL